MDKLAELNDADDAQAVALVEPLIERAPQIAHRVAARRPFGSTEELQHAIRNELLNLAEDERVRLFCAHPELAPVNPLSMTQASQTEQGRLNLTSSSNEYRSRLDELNSEYRRKFGFPFITALVRHQDMRSVMSEFEARLQADRRSEIDTALDQVATVSATRVRAAFCAAEAADQKDCRKRLSGSNA